MLDRHDEALALFREALEIRERVAPDARGTLMDRANVADELDQLGRAGDAEPLLRQVLAERLRTLGPSHGDVALAHVQLGSALSTLGRYDESRREYEQARAIYVALHGPAHPAVARAFHDEAVNERRRHRNGAAARLASRALELRLHALPAGHPERIESLAEVAADLEDRGEHRKAVELATQAVDEASGEIYEAARARWVLAQILAASAGTRERARELATDARSRFSRLAGQRARDLTVEIDGWLAGRAP